MVRGPRQVGKSAELKLLARRAPAGGRPASHVLSVTLDLLAGEASDSVVDTVRRAEDPGPWPEGGLLLLDEVRAVREWHVAVRYLWDTSIVDRYRPRPTRQPSRSGLSGRQTGVMKRLQWRRPSRAARR